MKTFKPQDEHFNNFPELLKACQTTYTLPFKHACQMLKCSRSWAQNYIRPHVPCVYLSNGIRDNGQYRINYARIVSERFGKASDESIYLDEKAFNKYIFQSIVSCQKRSKCVCASYFMNPSQYKNYLFNLVDLRYKLCTCKPEDAVESLRLLHEISKVYRQYIDTDILQIIDTPASCFKRTDSEYIDVPVPNAPIASWMAVHDLMDYGDVEETIYRRLYKNGCIRIELRLPDKNGEVKNSGKIYYITDPEPIIPQPVPDRLLQKWKNEYGESFLNGYFNTYIPTDSYYAARQNLYTLDDSLVITQSAWQNYCKQFGKDFLY